MAPPPVIARHIIVAIVGLAGVLALVAGVRLLVEATVVFPEPEPWVDGLPLVVREGAAPPEALVMMAGQIVGKSAIETDLRGPASVSSSGAFVRPNAVVLRVESKLALPADTRFLLKEISGNATIVVAPGTEKTKLGPWAEVDVEPE